MEYLDIYDENKKYIGKETRAKVHEDALWHNTVHCWIYDKEGNIYFQIRKEENKFYTTASGHVLAGETIKEAFGREIKEEIGIDLEYNRAQLVDVVTFVMDRPKSDGTVFRDRAFANVYVYVFDGNIEEFEFDLSEINGLVKVSAKQTIELLKEGEGQIPAEIIVSENGKNTSYKKQVSFGDFLVNAHETAIGKYGDVLNKVIELVK